MSNNSTVFQLYRYQLLPIDRYLQGDLLTGVSTIEELIERKNEFFSLSLDGVSGFSDTRHETITKKLYAQNSFYLYRIAHNKTIRRETKEFKNETIDSWPSILVAIWNSPDKQIIAIQKRTTAFTSTDIVANMIIKSIGEKLSQYHLSAIKEPLFEKQRFWDVVSENEGKVKAVIFEIITPNMANISGTLPDELKAFAKHANSTKNTLSLESDPQAPLHLERNDPTLNGLVDYSSEGGGNITLKIDGIKKRYQTSKTIKEVSLGDMELSGPSEEVANIIKELMT